MQISDERLQQFWARTKEAANGCLEWQGGLNTNGYGHTEIHGQRWLAHRLSWTVTHGAIPEGLFVLHNCDNPRCVLPDHLRIGTNADNVRDMMERGRHRPVRGEAHSASKLTEQQVREIRIRAANGEKKKPLAREYGVTDITIRYIVKRVKWKHVTDEPGQEAA